ncbi:MAG: methionine--tRNA ligase [Mycoplasmataceae bacterium]|nr:methionine--tRNA ligase [Mycoplasmataceae bacterium]
MTKKFYISTPIYYPNAKLHIGHAYTTTLADYVNRYKKFRGYETYFVTGSDEHGQKIEDKAKESGESPLVFVTKIINTFKDLWKDLGIDYDHFIRTTDKTHINYVKTNFSLLLDKGYIYKGYYEGWYCKSDEAFFTNSQLTKEHKCPECGNSVELLKEESYFLKITDFKKWIKQALKHDDILFPHHRVSELINNFITDLQDLSITRTTFKWGIPITEDKNHIVYVWLDALQNYLSTLTYKDAPWSVDDVWGVDSDVEILQIIGKEITRFHAIYWPIILKMLNYREPKILAHGWIVTDKGEKMSKSKGNVVDPSLLINKYGRDSLRFFLINNIITGEDGKFSENLLIENINGLLVNKFSNLISRTDSMVKKYFDGIVPNGGKLSTLELHLNKKTDLLLEKYYLAMDQFDFSKSTKILINYVEKLNHYVDQSEPWKKVDDPHLATILNFLIKEIFNISSLLGSILIDSYEEVCNWLSVTNKNHEDNLNTDFANVKLKPIEHLFKRI